MLVAGGSLTLLTCYGGVGEVGGNMVSIRERESGAHILLDAGLSYSLYRRFYDFPFRVPQSSVELELVRTGILPSIQGLDGTPLRYYVEVERRGERPAAREPGEGENDVGDVFVSHVHMDHSRLCSVLAKGIRVWMGELARSLYLEWMKLIPRADLFTTLFHGEGEEPRGSHPAYRSGIPLQAGGLEVLPIAVDHSVPSAYGFIVTAPDGAVGYTGDIRFHGPAARLSREFVEEARSRELDVLVTEGTNFGEARPLGEADVARVSEELMRKGNELGSPLAIVRTSSLDVDRVSTIVGIAQGLGSEVLLTDGLATVLHVAGGYGERLRFTRLPEAGRDYVIYVEKEDVEKAADKRIRFLLEAGLGDQMVTPSEYREEYASKPHVIVSRGDLNLFKLAPRPGSLYLFSTSEPFNEEGEIDLEREVNTAQLLGLVFYHLHASGHALPMDLIEVIREIKPKKVIPIHTEHPEAFTHIFPPGSPIETITPAKGVPITL